MSSPNKNDTTNTDQNVAQYFFIGVTSAIAITQAYEYYKRHQKQKKKFPTYAWGNGKGRFTESSYAFQLARDRFDDVGSKNDRVISPVERNRKSNGSSIAVESSSSATAAVAHGSTNGTASGAKLSRTDLEAVAGFEAAAAYAATRIAEGAVPDDCILELYGIYKQATKGDCAINAPTRLDVKAYAKYKAWIQHTGIGKIEACRMYVKVLETRLDDLELSPRSKSKQSSSSGGFVGRSQSTMKSLASGRAEAEEEEQAALTEGQGQEYSLLKAAKEGNFDAFLKCLRDRRGVNVNCRDSKGRTPLMFAADIGDSAIALQLLVAHADVNLGDENGKTALHYAAICEQSDVAVHLLEAGADPDLEDKNGASAASLGIYEVVKKGNSAA